MTHDFDGLAATGSNVTPWLVIGGIIVLLGVIALVIAGIVRSRRAEQQVENAAEKVAAAGGTLPEPDSNAPTSDETILDEAAELGGAGSAAGAGGVAAAGAARASDAEPQNPVADPAEITPDDEFAPNVGPLGQDINAPADTSWPADGESYPEQPAGDEPAKQTPPAVDPQPEDDDPSK